MNQLWAPWRLSYVANAKPPASGDPCFICQAMQGSDDRASLLAFRNPKSVVLLNRFPYNNGHLLVSPKLHKGKLEDLEAAEMLEIMSTIRDMIARLDKKIHPDGYNVGLNLGQAAGAGLPGHLHWHIVPRWNGDTNFMPVLSDTKVIAQSLESLYDLLKSDG